MNATEMKRHLIELKMKHGPPSPALTTASFSTWKLQTHLWMKAAMDTEFCHGQVNIPGSGGGLMTSTFRFQSPSPLRFLGSSTAFLPWESRQSAAFCVVKSNQQSVLLTSVWKVHVFQMWISKQCESKTSYPLPKWDIRGQDHLIKLISAQQS